MAINRTHTVYCRSYAPHAHTLARGPGAHVWYGTSDSYSRTRELRREARSCHRTDGHTARAPCDPRAHAPPLAVRGTPLYRARRHVASTMLEAGVSPTPRCVDRGPPRARIATAWPRQCSPRRVCLPPRCALTEGATRQHPSPSPPPMCQPPPARRMLRVLARSLAAASRRPATSCSRPARRSCSSCSPCGCG